MSARPRGRIAIGIAITLLLGAIPVLVIALSALGFHSVSSHAAPLPPGESFYPVYAEVLSAVSEEGEVSYASLSLDREPLARVVATLAIAGPKGRPDLFPTQADELAYYVNAYNALTLFGVIEHWPIETVHDVQGAVNPAAGFGFFYAQRFLLDGRRVNLHNLEHKVIRGEFGDARIHAALNCASASCPRLAPEPYYPETLHAQLDEAAARFARAPYVEVDAQARQIRLSSIYKWYAADFERDAERFGWGTSTLDWIAYFADEATREALDEGVAAGFSVVFSDYDWSLNGA